MIRCWLIWTNWTKSAKLGQELVWVGLVWFGLAGADVGWTKSSQAAVAHLHKCMLCFLNVYVWAFLYL